MKVCHFLPWYSPATRGGTEIYILHLSKQLVNAGVEVIILCPSKSNNVEEFMVDGISVIASPFIPILQPQDVESGKKKPVFFNEFTLLLKKLKPDVLHFHCFWSKHIYYLEKAKALNIKTFITPHLAKFTCMQTGLMYANKIPCNGKVELFKCGTCLIKSKTSNILLQQVISISALIVNKLKVNFSDSNKLFRSLNIFDEIQCQIGVLKRVNASVDAIIPISYWYFNVLELNKIFDSNKLKLIPTSISLINKKAISRNNTDPLRIIFIGRQSYEKGLHLLLDAISQLPPASMELHLFGKETEKKIADQVNILVANGYKIFQYGETAHKTILTRLSEMDILCIPSLGIEMSPLVVHEALALNVPVIGADRGGIKDLIDDGINGFLFKYNDSKDLFDKLKYIFDNPLSISRVKSKNEKTTFLDSHLNLYSAI